MATSGGKSELGGEGRTGNVKRRKVQPLYKKKGDDRPFEETLGRGLPKDKKL